MAPDPGVVEKESYMAEDRPDKPTKNIIRLVETNLDGNKPVRLAITRVKGVGEMFSNAVCSVSGLGERRLSDLSEGEIKNLEEIILNPSNHGIPAWLYNRRFDPKTGETKHLSVSTLDFIQKMDVDREKRLKTYRGIRHIQHLPVRGQRTRGSFRKGKTVGVSRKKK